VEAAAPRLPLAAGEPRAQPAAELTDEIACLLHVARGEVAKRELHEREPSRQAARATGLVRGVPPRGCVLGASGLAARARRPHRRRLPPPRVRGFLGRPAAAAGRPPPARRRQCTPAAGDAPPPPARLALGTGARGPDGEKPVGEGGMFFGLCQSG